VNVPPFIPLPIEIPGNVSTEPYLVRVGFIKRVVVLHFLSACLVAALALMPLPKPPVAASAVVAVVLLAAISLVRTVVRGYRTEQWLSWLLSPLLFLSLARTLSGLQEAGWPVWTVGPGLVAALAFTMLCGRDLSFVGMFFLSGIGSSVAIVVIWLQMALDPRDIGMGIGLNLAYLLYYVYDLGALLSRRRMGEELGAVIDLYRDVLNLFGYSVRVVRHWREHRIWSK